LHLRNSVTKNKGIRRKYMETKGIIKKSKLYLDSEQQCREPKEAFERIEKPYTNMNAKSPSQGTMDNTDAYSTCQACSGPTDTTMGRCLEKRSWSRQPPSALRLPTFRPSAIKEERSSRNLTIRDRYCAPFFIFIFKGTRSVPELTSRDTSGRDGGAIRLPGGRGGGLGLIAPLGACFTGLCSNTMSSALDLDNTLSYLTHAESEILLGDGEPIGIVLGDTLGLSFAAAMDRMFRLGAVRIPIASRLSLIALREKAGSWGFSDHPNC